MNNETYSSGSWSCQYNLNNVCAKVGNKLPCIPGMKGCIIQGTVTFNEPKAPEGHEETKSDKPLFRKY